MPLYAKALGFSDIDTGKIMSVTTLGILLACVLSGKLSDMAAGRLENRAAARITVLMVGPIIILASVFLLLLFHTSGLFFFTLCTLFLSFGSAWGFGSYYCILPEIFSEEELPVVTGLSGGLADTAMPLAPLAVGVVFGMRGLWTFGWATCIAVALISLVSCWILIRFQRMGIPKTAVRFRSSVNS